jgi:LPXTG-site transpeptidase (sortase) family protein
MAQKMSKKTHAQPLVPVEQSLRLNEVPSVNEGLVVSDDIVDKVHVKKSRTYFKRSSNKPALKRSRLNQFLAWTNRALSTVAILGALYLALLPYLPQLYYQYSKKTNPVQLYSDKATDKNVDPASLYPDDNRIVIPSAHIDQAIVEGTALDVIEDGGAWRKPLWNSGPEEAGNTVIVGHRFTYQNPLGTFYALDKVAVGDTVALYWNKKELLYKITEIKEVDRFAIEVEDNTTERMLTLYTCTPLITAENRLVITATPVNKEAI